MGALLPLVLPFVVQLVEAIVANAPAVIAEVKVAVSGAPITDAMKADLHSRLDATAAKVAAVTYVPPPA